MHPLKILLVDDHVASREQVETLLHSEADLKVVATAGSAEEALDMDRKFHPDVVIMDIMMPGMNGIEATRRILSGHPEAKIIALSNHSGTVVMQSVFDAGGLGYVHKNSSDKELIPAIHSVGAGKKYSSTGALVWGPTGITV